MFKYYYLFGLALSIKLFSIYGICGLINDISCNLTTEAINELDNYSKSVIIMAKITMLLSYFVLMPLFLPIYMLMLNTSMYLNEHYNINLVEIIFRI